MNRVFAAGLLAASLSACTSTYVATPYAAGPQPISRVGIADDALPEGVSAVETASVGSNFGLVGALIDAGVRDSREDAIDAALATVSFDAESDLEHMLTEALAANRIETFVADNGPRAERKFLVNYPTADGNVQAYLDLVATHYGYTSAGHGQPWRPTANVMVRLVSVPDNRTLMENRIAYNVMNSPRGVITLSPNPDFTFNNREEMRTDPERLANGIRAAFREIATTAAGLIR
jgi:hypothetical protein